MEPELIVGCRCAVGEAPLWHPTEHRLYWIDAPAGRLHRYDPATDEHAVVHEGDVVGGLTVQRDGSLLLFGAGGSVTRWSDGHAEPVVEALPGERDSRFNDVIADPEGRVFCGTMPTGDRPGRLYRLNPNGEFTTLLERVDVPNGFGFSPAYDRLYFTETGAGIIHAFDYDRETGMISNRQTFADAADEPGKPDGLTVDADGYVWSARWGGGCLVRYASDGTEVNRLTFPVEKVSSLAFGGRNCSSVYVTTAGGNDSATSDVAGGLFGVPIGVPGHRECFSQIEI